MILVDYHKGSIELMSLINGYGVKAERADLKFGDFMFEGNGPRGIMGVGIERKSLHDMLNCIDDAHYSGHQLGGMAKMYGCSILIVEGLWRPHDGNGLLMEGFVNKESKLAWGFCRPGSATVMYSKIRRYLFSVSLANVIVCYTRDQAHTAYDITEWYHYFQKKWSEHTALMQLQKPNLPYLMGKPSLVRRWANELEGVGVTLSEVAEKRFERPIDLANSNIEEWLEVPGIGLKTAASIVKEIWSE